MSKSLKITLISIGILIVIGVLVWNFLPARFVNFAARDSEPINDSDLSLPETTLPPPNENAYFDLVKAQSFVVIPEETLKLIIPMASDKTWDEQAAEKLIAKNTQVFELVAQAAQKNFQDPIFLDISTLLSTTEPHPFKSIGDFRQLLRLNEIHALYLAKHGRYQEAIDVAFLFLKIGKHIQDSRVSLFGSILGNSIKSSGLTLLHKIITTFTIGSDDLRRYTQELNEFYEDEENLIALQKFEYQIFSSSVDFVTQYKKMPSHFLDFNSEQEKTFFSEGLKNSYDFQPNKTKLLGAEFARHVIQYMNTPCGFIPKYTSPLDKSVTQISDTENAVGKVFVHTYKSIFPMENKCMFNFRIETIRTLTALKAFKNDIGRLPVSLNELTPTYLSSVPIDPFDGKQLRYSSEKKILYSIGKDMKDSGGGSGDNILKMADPTFMIPF